MIGYAWEKCHDTLKSMALQATIEKGKITEPKTPYHAPLDDATLEIPPLDLDISTAINAAGGEVGGFNKSRQDHYKVKDLKSLLAKKADDDDEADEA